MSLDSQIGVDTKLCAIWFTLPISVIFYIWAINCANRVDTWQVFVCVRICWLKCRKFEILEHLSQSNFCFIFFFLIQLIQLPWDTSFFRQSKKAKNMSKTLKWTSSKSASGKFIFLFREIPTEKSFLKIVRSVEGVSRFAPGERSDYCS